MYSFSIAYFLVLQSAKVRNQTTGSPAMSCVSRKENSERTWKALEAVEASLVSYQELDDLSGISSSCEC